MVGGRVGQGWGEADPVGVVVDGGGGGRRGWVRGDVVGRVCRVLRGRAAGKEVVGVVLRVGVVARVHHLTNLEKNVCKNNRKCVCFLSERSLKQLD